MEELKKIENELNKKYKEEQKNIKTIKKLELINTNLKRKRKELLKKYIIEYVKIRKKLKNI